MRPTEQKSLKIEERTGFTQKSSCDAPPDAQSTTTAHVLPVSFQTTIGLLLLIAATVFSSGCGTNLGAVKRAPLRISPLKTRLAVVSQTNLVRFESTFPGEPLAETVWDNVRGAFVDARESEQIGFTQNYLGLFTAAAMGGIPAEVDLGTQPDYTRIVIPFGRIFEGVFQSGVQKVYPNSLVCSDDSSESEILQTARPGHIIRLRVTEFYVWENPLNHINLIATVECRVYRGDKPEQQEYSCEAHQEITTQSVGSVMTTSGGFIKHMNKISNAFAASLSEKILEKLQANLGE